MEVSSEEDFQSEMNDSSEEEFQGEMDISFEEENLLENVEIEPEENVGAGEAEEERMREDDNPNEEMEEAIPLNEAEVMHSESSSENDGDDDDDDDADDGVVDDDDEIAGPRSTLFQGIDHNLRMNIPLQNDINIKANDLFLVAVAQNVAHKQTYKSLIDQLHWEKVKHHHCNLPTTKKQLWKVMKRDKSNLIYSVYCTLCKEKVGDGKVLTRLCYCGECGPNKANTNVGTFILVNIIPQLNDLFEVPNIAKSLRYRYERVKINHANKEDIYDGDEYQRLSEEGQFLSEEFNFSFTLWVDGVSLTKSSNASACPILLHINELPPHARSKHVLLAGMYVGNKKPEITHLLLPIVDQLNDLHERGIRWFPDGPGGREVVSKFMTLILTADSVAKPEVLRTCPHNSYYGCPKCYARGAWVNNKLIYPFEPIVLRTHDEICIAMETAALSNQEILGVKGCSPLMNLNDFDLAAGVVHDDVHGYFLGCAKQITSRLLEDCGKNWYIGSNANKKIIDDKLKKIRLPSRISRRPRSVSTYRKWKASEWRNCLLYLAPACLEGILKEPYFTNFMLLSKSVFILNNTSISEEELTASRIYLRQFVSTANIYGDSNMTFNVHLTEHGPDSVQLWGPSWAYSTFPFESFCSKLKNDVKSPHARADQIVDRFLLRKFVEAAFYKEDVAAKTKAKIRKLLDIKNEPILEDMIPGHYYVGVGKTKHRRPNDFEIRLIREAEEIINENTIVDVHSDAKIHGVKYKVHDNVKRKFCDSIAYNGRAFFSIRRFLSYRIGERKVAGFIGKKFQFVEYLYGTNYISRVAPSETMSFVSFSDVTVPGTVFCINEKYTAIPISNISSID